MTEALGGTLKGILLARDTASQKTRAALRHSNRPTEDHGSAVTRGEGGRGRQRHKRLP